MPILEKKCFNVLLIQHCSMGKCEKFYPKNLVRPAPMVVQPLYLTKIFSLINVSFEMVFYKENIFLHVGSIVEVNII